MYHHILEEGWDCAFGSRFMPGAVLTDYPRIKLVVNRMANAFDWGWDSDDHVRGAARVLHRIGYKLPGFVLR